jgi:hypothetical protein
MNRLKVLSVLGVLAALLLAMVVILPARADPPEIIREHWTFDGTIDVCGPELPWHEEVNFSTMEHCTRGGDICGANTHYNKGKLTLSNPDTGYSLTFYGASNERVVWINWYDAIYEITGNRYMVTVPGYGPIWGTPGREIVYETCEGEWPDTWVCEYETLFFAGPSFDDLEAVCEYLLTGEVIR